jgi:predicted deacylase
MRPDRTTQAWVPPQAPDGGLDIRDLSAWRDGNTGVDFATSFDSGHSGPHVMITALVHGNELCGAVALDRLLGAGLRPQRGRLTLAFADVEAHARFDPTLPAASRYVDEDLNRVWAAARLDGPDGSSELRRARALRPLIDRADRLLDLHSMTHDTAPLLLCPGALPWPGRSGSPAGSCATPAMPPDRG